MADGFAPSESALRIEGEMTIYRAHELKQLLMDALQPLAHVEVDLSAVTEIDTAGLQLLVLAKRTSGQRQGQLRLVRHSPAVLEVFELLNVAAFFGDPLVMAPRASQARV